MIRKRTIKVEQRRGKTALTYQYRVLQTTNTTTPKLGELLSEMRVNELATYGYEVTVVQSE